MVRGQLSYRFSYGKGDFEKEKGKDEIPSSRGFSLSPAITLPVNPKGDTTRQKMELIPGKLRCRKAPCRRIRYTRSNRLGS